MPGYLLDTNICILLLRGKPTVAQHIIAADAVNSCFISEITAAELYFGAEKSRSGLEAERTAAFIDTAQVLPISPALKVYAQQRWRLQQQGQPLDDFDLLIGTTALVHNLVMVTNNIRHFARLPLKLADWSLALEF